MKQESSTIIDKLTDHAKNSLEKAETIARSDGKKETSPEHLLYGIFLEKGSVGNNILKNIGLKKESFEKVIFSEKETKKTSLKSKPSSILKKIITDAYVLASGFGYPYVGTEHFTYVLLDLENTKVKKILKSAKKTKSNSEKNSLNSDMFENLSNTPPMGGMSSLTLADNDLDADQNNVLDKFCIDLGQDKENKPFIGRKDEVERIVSILGRKNKNNPILIGEAGVGKTALIEHIAQLANTPDAPSNLYNKRILMLDLALLVAGTSFRGEFEQRLKNIVTEVESRPDTILFIDEIHTIIGTGNTGGSLDAANILKPALARGFVQIIGATTFDEYKKYIEKDPALTRRFQKVTLKESTPKETLAILKGLKKSYEKYHHVSLSPEVLKSAVDLSVRYVQESHLPDKAIDLLDETASRLNSKIKNNSIQKEIVELETDLKEIALKKTECVKSRQYKDAASLRNQESEYIDILIDLQEKMKKDLEKNVKEITVEDIAQTTALISGIPYEKISLTLEKKLNKTYQKLSKIIIGQEPVLKSITQTLNRSITGVSSEKRPYGSFLFLGPTGVGKTLTAQTLASEVYGSEESLIRVDMSELMEKHHTSKLIGAPAGYIGYGEGGSLTEKVRRNPYSVILFDEIEKAHPDVFNILLQILEDGILHDGEGRLINFRHSIIILTSNIGNRFFLQNNSLGFGGVEIDKNKKVNENVLKEIRQILSPEILSRLDNKIVFNVLDEAGLIKIARNEILKLKNRLKKRNVNLVYSQKMINKIARKAVKLNEGARGVRKIIYDKVENIVAEFIIENVGVKDIKLDLKGEEIVVKK